MGKWELKNGNSLNYGIPNLRLHKLQIVQNCAARTISGSHKCEQMAPILHYLQWLNEKFRVIFTIVMQTFKCLHAQYMYARLNLKSNSKRF